jgi:hypothetical protein
MTKAKKAKVKAKPKAAVAKPETVLVLRTCAADMTSHNGFRWPESGPVEALDWKPIAECGNGLHGLLRGEGNGELLNWDANAKWLVVEVEASAYVDLKGKVKFPRGVVVYAGDRQAAVARIQAAYPGSVCVRGTATAGDRGTATAGVSGTATAGDRGTATAGVSGTATAGVSGTICIRWWDGAQNRYRIAVGYIGEDGLLANVKYRYDVDAKKFVEVKT